MNIILKNIYLTLVLLCSWRIVRTRDAPPTLDVPTITTATKPPSITTAWKTSFQITALIPPWKVQNHHRAQQISRSLNTGLCLVFMMIIFKGFIQSPTYHANSNVKLWFQSKTQATMIDCLRFKASKKDLFNLIINHITVKWQIKAGLKITAGQRTMTG